MDEADRILSMDFEKEVHRHNTAMSLDVLILSTSDGEDRPRHPKRAHHFYVQCHHVRKGLIAFI